MTMPTLARRALCASVLVCCSAAVMAETLAGAQESDVGNGIRIHTMLDNAGCVVFLDHPERLHDLLADFVKRCT
jgi:hypothetical protein